MWETIFERIDAMVTWNDCRDAQEACRKEVDRDVEKVRKCSAQKVERSTAKWFLALLVPVLVTAIGCGIAFAFRISERSAKNETAILANEKDLARIHSKLDRILEFMREAAAK